MKFQPTDRNNAVLYDVNVDDDGDLNFSLLGIRVFYISTRNGTIRRYPLSHPQAKKLTDAGFELKSASNKTMTIAFQSFETGDELL
jgi:hypothetical protein